MLKSLFMSTAALALAASGAQAVTTVTSVNGPDGGGKTVIFDFNSTAPAGLSGNYDITTGTAHQLFAAPLGDTTPYLVVPGNGTSGSALLDLGASYGNLSFYWGSIDTYNTVEFFSGANGTGTSLGAFGGDDIPSAPANGSQGSALNNRRVFFDFNGDKAGSIRFSSSNIAFELDDIATAAIPEPATWSLMVAGFGMIGVGIRRRRNASRHVSA